MIRVAAWRGLIGVSLCASAMGCQLVVGEIELPTLIQEVDRGPLDAQILDAEIADARPDMPPPDLDVGAVDAAWDAVAPPVDLGVDLAVDLAVDSGPDAWAPDVGGTPTDLTSLAGTWHLYGARGRQQNLTLFTAALNIDGDGSATLTEIGSMVPLSDVETLFNVHPDGTAGLSINLLPRAGRLAGMMDPIAGVGTFVNDLDFGDTTPTFIVAARVNALTELPPDLVYVDMQVEPRPGVGEAGTLVRDPLSATYQQQGRVVFDSPGAIEFIPGRGFNAVYSNRQRVVLTEDPMAAEGFALSPVAGGYGAAGVYGPQADPARLVFAWTVIQSEIFLPARYWCAGHGLDADGRHRSLSAFAVLGPEGITWDNGGAATLETGDDLFNLFSLTAEQNFFGHTNGYLTMDPEQRVLMLVDLDQPSFRWGLGVCINVTPAGP